MSKEEKILKRLEFEKNWLIDLYMKDELQIVDFDNSFFALESMIKDLAKGDENK